MVDFGPTPPENPVWVYFAQAALFDKSPKVRLAAARSMTCRDQSFDFDASQLMSGIGRLGFVAFDVDIAQTIRHNLPHLANRIPSVDEWLADIKDNW
jgi:hypothetical protein